MDSRAGIGAIITGFTSVSLRNYYFGGMMRLCDDALIPQYMKLTELIHAEGVPVITQLALGAYYREVKGRYMQVEPDQMTPEEIQLVIGQFIDAAVRAEKAGFDGVQISGMPIHMEGFHLFDEKHRSSYPLNIAYKAAQMADPEKADRFLYQLRYATIVETRQTTLLEELTAVAVEAGIDRSDFLGYIHDKSAEAAFLQDLAYTRSLGIYSLPAYLLQYKDQAILINRMMGYHGFEQAIRQLTGGRVLPTVPSLSTETLTEFLNKHPLISSIELCEAFGAANIAAIKKQVHFPEDVTIF